MEVQDKKSVVVYMESTPNPSAMKFVTNQLLLANAIKEYQDKASAIESPLAYQLFDFSGIKNVFISNNFITINKSDDIDWFDIQNIVREFIRVYLVTGDPVFSDSVVINDMQISNPVKDSPFSVPVNFSDTEEKIIAVLDEYIKPAVEQDGGAIEFQSYDSGKLTLLLRGACSGCPSSMVTLKSGIERLMQQMIPEVKEVVAFEE